MVKTSRPPIQLSTYIEMKLNSVMQFLESGMLTQLLPSREKIWLISIVVSCHIVLLSKLSLLATTLSHYIHTHVYLLTSLQPSILICPLPSFYISHGLFPSFLNLKPQISALSNTPHQRSSWFPSAPSIHYTSPLPYSPLPLSSFLSLKYNSFILSLFKAPPMYTLFFLHVYTHSS